MRNNSIKYYTQVSKNTKTVSNMIKSIKWKFLVSNNTLFWGIVVLIPKKYFFDTHGYKKNGCFFLMVPKFEFNSAHNFPLQRKPR
jgi:hypothetical protein